MPELALPGVGPRWLSFGNIEATAGRTNRRLSSALEPVHLDEATVKTVAEKDVVCKAPNPWERPPTPTQKAWWKAI